MFVNCDEVFGILMKQCDGRFDKNDSKQINE